MAHGKHLFCNTCGAQYAELTWPRQCAACGEAAYRSPEPVAVVLQPVGDGLLVTRRGVDVGYGKLALPGGYVDYGETWQQGAARELWEEVGVKIDAEALRHVNTVSTPPGSHVLIFALAPAIEKLPPFKENRETLAVEVITDVVPLAFDLHTDMVRWYFAQKAIGAL